MNISYQLSVDDLLEGLRETNRKRPPWRILRSAVLWSAVGLLGFVRSFYSGGDMALAPTVIANAWPLSISLIALIALVFGSITALNHWWLIPRTARKQFAQLKRLQDTTELSIEEQGLRFRDANGNSLVPWGHIRKWHEATAHLIIYLTDVQILVVPKRAFSDLAELDQLRALLSTQVTAS